MVAIKRRPFFSTYIRLMTQWCRFYCYIVKQPLFCRWPLFKKSLFIQIERFIDKLFIQQLDIPTSACLNISNTWDIYRMRCTSYSVGSKFVQMCSIKTGSDKFLCIPSIALLNLSKGFRLDYKNFDENMHNLSIILMSLFNKYLLLFLYDCSDRSKHMAHLVLGGNHCLSP